LYKIISFGKDYSKCPNCKSNEDTRKYNIEVYTKLKRFVKIKWIKKIGKYAKDKEIRDFIKSKMSAI